ncbi:hypothetical protein BC835DRAFT_1424720 [Cytidiella melzeri]|nr:hypothetical protein BC835DRAFT_1424720 [Cytidiella melzeri]
MPRLSKRKQTAINNLGQYAQPSKRPRQAAPDENNKENNGNVHHMSTTTVDPKAVEVSLERAASLRARAAETFHEICQPTWAPEMETVSMMEDREMRRETPTRFPDSSLPTEAPVDFSQIPNTRSESSFDFRNAADPDARFEPPPSIAEAQAAWLDIKNILQPRRKSGRGYLRFEGDEGLRRRLAQMRMFLYKYANGTMGWISASLDTMRNTEASKYMARKLREWTRAFIRNRQALPYSG